MEKAGSVDGRAPGMSWAALPGVAGFVRFAPWGNLVNQTLVHTHNTQIVLGGHTGWVRSLAVTGKWLFR